MTRESEPPDNEPENDALAGRLSGLLRTTSVEIDPSRREQAVSAALESVVKDEAQRHRRARTSMRGTKVLAIAAAALVLVGGVAVLASELSKGTGSESLTAQTAATESGTSSDSSTESLQKNQEADSALSSPSAGADSVSPNARADAPAKESSGSLVDLGEFPDRADLLARIEEVNPEGSGPSPAEQSVCQQRVEALNGHLIAIATISGTKVVVVRVDQAALPDGFVVVDASSCTVFD